MTEFPLSAKAYLLACDVGKGKLRDRHRASLLVSGAAMTDLALRGRVADADGRVTVSGAGPTGDLVLDELLAEIAGERPRKWKWWVRKDARGILEAVESQLDTAGVIEMKTGRTLGLFPSRHPIVRDPAVVDRLRVLVDQALRGSSPVSDVDAALTTLVAAVELRDVIPGKDRRRYKERIEELTEQGGDAVPALRKLFKEMRAVQASVASSPGGS
ncbi:GOLPH3/VPS74 family protein [Amycolatopsis sp. cmx-11-51]|uniref:GOLPH3/VPS74 family protein n=1 Tax=unclassified Amycolatopsis TaxID=2618356 RepID=UPI0039E36D01